MKITSLCAGLALAMLAVSATADNTFKVCADPLNPPYSSKNQDGFENKIAELFAKELGQKLEYTWFPQRIGFLRNTLNAPVDEKAVDSKNFKCDVVMNIPEGSDMALATEPYYRSTYVMLIAKGRGWDDITDTKQLVLMEPERQEKLRIAMFDRSPGTAWIQKNGLLDQGIPYQSMSGDEHNNIAMQLDQDLKAKKIDMVILWGPLAGYIISQNPKNSFTMIPMPASPGIPFEFSMAMGVRNGDKDRKALLDKLIKAKAKDIQKIIAAYHIPLVDMPKGQKKHDDDD
jgi:quinoprotein dehydrogenase-associated probable ABC transporter substrate-binding protein